MATVEQTLERLSRSAFRARFHLTKEDRALTEEEQRRIVNLLLAWIQRQMT